MENVSIWEQLVDRKQEFVGKILIDYGDSFDQANGLVGRGGAITIITDMTLKSNGPDSKYFSVIGKDFTCGVDIGHGSVTTDEKVLIVYGYGGHRWTIETAVMEEP